MSLGLQSPVCQGPRGGPSPPDSQGSHEGVTCLISNVTSDGAIRQEAFPVAFVCDPGHPASTHGVLSRSPHRTASTAASRGL